jgi:hypothetical protein
MRYFTILFAIPIALFLGCSHSSTAPSTSPIDSTKKTTTYYSIVGSVVQVVTDQSGYDTVVWIASTDDSIGISGPRSYKAYTGLSGTFFFDSLPAGNYTIDANFKGFVPSLYPVTEPDPLSSQNVIHIYPQSWIQATIDSVRLDSDASLGQDVWVRLSSQKSYLPSLGTVYLYLSTQRGIDPNVPSSYQLVYEQIGNVADSTIKISVEPQLVHSTFPSGTSVFCTAFASPYQGKYVFASYDSTGKKSYPYFGEYPANTVQFSIP